MTGELANPMNGRSKRGRGSHGHPLVSVVVLGAGVEDHTPLGASLRCQTMPRYDVVAVPGRQAPAAGLDVASLNAAVPGTEAEYVLIASSAATLDPTLLEKCFWFLATHPRYDFVNAYERRLSADGTSSVFSMAFYDRDAVIRSAEIGLHVMVRRRAFLELGGFDESRDAGAATWEFWLRAAQAGRWGSTVSEVLVERPVGEVHGDPDPRAIAANAPAMRERFPRLFAGHVPVIEPRWPKAFEPVREEAPGSWRSDHAAAPVRYPAAATGREAARMARRLLLIVPWLRMGGADKFNLDVCRLLKDRGWDLTIACTAPSNDEWLGLFQKYTRDIFQPHRFLHWADYPILLRSLIETREPDVVLISNSELAYHLVPYFRAYCPEPLYVDYVHMEEDEWKSGGHARHSAGMHEQLDLSMVTSEHLKRWMVQRGATAERVAVVPIGVDERRWKPDTAQRGRVRQDLGIPAGMPVILHAGRICEQKQPMVLARTLQMLAEGGSDYVALIIGDGEDRPRLEKFIADHGLASRVRMLGEQPPERVREVMAAADVFFVPSRWEGVALVLYEAMAAGVVFVGAEVGGQGEVGGDGCAVLLRRIDGEDVTGESRRYADVIGPLLGDAGHRSEITARARRRIEERFTHDAMIEGVLRSIERAATLRATGPRQRCSPALAQEVAVRAVEMVRLEWQAGELWKERDYWKAAASRMVVDEGISVGRGRVGQLLRRLKRGLGG